MSGVENVVRPWADKAAIGLSVVCALHCLLLPVAVVMLPAISSMAVGDESFHIWMVFAVVPLSFFALFLGCRQHRQGTVLVLGLAGLAVLILTPLLGHDVLGETGERAMTLLGATLIAISHVQNYRLCRRPAVCNCQD